MSLIALLAAATAAAAAQECPLHQTISGTANGKPVDYFEFPSGAVAGQFVPQKTGGLTPVMTISACKGRYFVMMKPDGGKLAVSSEDVLYTQTIPPVICARGLGGGPTASAERVGMNANDRVPCTMAAPAKAGQ